MFTMIHMNRRIATRFMLCYQALYLPIRSQQLVGLLYNLIDVQRSNALLGGNQ
jgi:hypothetical protein